MKTTRNGFDILFLSAQKRSAVRPFELSEQPNLELPNVLTGTGP